MSQTPGSTSYIEITGGDCRGLSYTRPVGIIDREWTPGTCCYTLNSWVAILLKERRFNRTALDIIPGNRIVWALVSLVTPTANEYPSTSTARELVQNITSKFTPEVQAP